MSIKITSKGIKVSSDFKIESTDGNIEIVDQVLDLPPKYRTKLKDGECVKIGQDEAMAISQLTIVEGSEFIFDKNGQLIIIGG